MLGRSVVRGLVGVAFTALLPLVPSPARADTGCQATYTPVRLRDGGPDNYRIYGELCGSAAPKRPGLVLLLLPGGTYNHYYWDIPYHRDRYSFVRYLTEAGYTTLNVDRIGTGLSSHPASPLVDIPSNAFVVLQLVEALRTGGIGGAGFDSVVLVGHSLGTLIAMTAASRYPGAVDGLVLTGITHHFNPEIVPDARTLGYPALTDPRFRDRDPGYGTSRSMRERGQLFFDLPSAEPGAIEADEAFSKDTITHRELGFFTAVINDGTTDTIRAPVFVAVGGHDRAFCGPLATDCASAETLAAAEEAHYPHATVTYFVQPNAGHSINLHPNARDWYAAALRWLDATM